jgi:putative membrane protein
MSKKAGSLSIIVIATATASLMLGAGALAQTSAGGGTQGSTQKPASGGAQGSTQKPASGGASERGQGGDRGQAGTSSGQAASGQSASAQGKQGTVKMADKNFLTHAAQGGEAEVELGRLAQQKAADAQVKAFGQRMETDHSKANSELRALITQKGVTVPGGMGPHTAVKNRLDKLQGATFDQAYMREMLNDHVKDVREFETASKSTDPDVKAFAEKTLPTLREHLKMAQDYSKSAGSSSRTSPTGSGAHSGTGTGMGTSGTGTGSGTTGTGTGGTGTGGTGTGGSGTRSGSGGTSTPRSGSGGTGSGTSSAPKTQ